MIIANTSDQNPENQPDEFQSLETEDKIPQRVIEKAFLKGNSYVPQQLHGMIFFMLNAIYASNGDLTITDLINAKVLSEQALQEERNAMRQLHARFNIPVYNLKHILDDDDVRNKIQDFSPELEQMVLAQMSLDDSDSLTKLFTDIKISSINSGDFVIIEEKDGDDVFQIKMSLNGKRLTIVNDFRIQRLYENSRAEALRLAYTNPQPDLIKYIVEGMKTYRAKGEFTLEQYRSSLMPKNRRFGYLSSSDILSEVINKIIDSSLEEKGSEFHIRLHQFLEIELASTNIVIR